MILQASDLFDETDAIVSRYARWLTGSQRIRTPANGLTLIEQTITTHQPITIEETVAAGVYFTFTMDQAGHPFDQFDTLQIQPILEASTVQWQVDTPKTFAWIQLYISWEQLATLTRESISQTQRFFLRHTGEDQSRPIQLPNTCALTQDIRHLLQHDGKRLGLIGKLYNVVFDAIEHVQVQRHISRCDGCQQKLFQAQNLLESNTTLSTAQLAHDVDLSVTALELGYVVITQMTLNEYQIEVAIRQALHQTTSGLSLARRINEGTGMASHDIEKACLKRFGVLSHQLGGMQ